MFEDDVATIDVPEVPKTLKKTRVVRPFFSSTPCMPKDTNLGILPACALGSAAIAPQTTARKSRRLIDCA